MIPYYILFALFTIASLLLKYFVINPYADSLLSLIEYGTLTIFPLLAAYFLFLFYATRGMKYFVARKPKVYSLLKNFHYENNM